MTNLFEGVINFQKEYFEENRELFSDLSSSQKPHTLYIGCSDSRIVPNIITKSSPGELFVVRNIANMVPPYDNDVKNFHCTISIIEYAVNVLNVDNILVCGHSNCGGCNALYYDEKELNKIPHVKQWLTLGHEVRDRVLKKNLSPEEREFQTEQLNVVKQIQNLFTYPFIKEKYEKKEIKIAGWYYVIEKGKIFNYNFKNRTFELICEEKL